MPRLRSVTKFTAPTIDVPLSEPEQRVKALELARMCGEIDKLKADAADAAGSARKRIRALVKEQRILAECVRTGVEKRDAQLEFSTEKKRSKGSGVDA